MDTFPVFDLLPADVLREMIFRTHLKQHDRFVARCVCRRFRALVTAMDPPPEPAFPGIIPHRSLAHGNTIAEGAVACGYLAQLDWLLCQQPPHAPPPPPPPVLRDLLWHEAAWRGRIAVLEWLETHDVVCGGRLVVALAAANSGHVDVLEWLAARWNQNDLRHDSVIRCAATRQDTRVLEWFFGRWPDFVRACADLIAFTATRFDRHAVLRWICVPDKFHELTPSNSIRTRLANFAIRCDARRSLLLLFELGATWEDTDPFAIAETQANADFILWLHEKGMAWEAYLTDILAQRGRMAMLRTAADAGCPLSDNCCNSLFRWLEVDNAAHAPWGDGDDGDVEKEDHAAETFKRVYTTMQWLRERRVPWTDETARKMRERALLAGLSPIL